MWTYSQNTGDLLDPKGNKVGTGYSGNGPGLNNPAMESVADVGPIPKGNYSIGPPYVHPTEGPYVMNLIPMLGTDTLGRSAFHIHGDNIKMDHSASKGCIILNHYLREYIWESGCHGITVII